MTEHSGTFLGKSLGNYLLTTVLGTGGFAEVYLGMHKHLETQAAIKVLKMQLNEAEKKSFIAEARTVARLKHPHIIRILEFGIEEDIPYLVMNYTANGTLRRRFPRGTPLEAEQFLPYLKQVASALQYAHDQGLIHRDIKPENMLLDEDDTVFLSDFGIATQARSSRSQIVEEVIGTVVYMAPEQLQGKPRPASDQYALGIVTYEWLCGVRPFSGSNYIEISIQQLKASPRPLREYRAKIAPAIEQVVLKTLSKDPHERYARVQDFADALEQAYATGRYRAPQDFVKQAVVPSLPSPPDLEPTQPATPYGQPFTQTIVQTLQPKSTDGRNLTRSTPAISRRTLLGTGIGLGVLVGGGITWWTATHSSARQRSSSANTASSTPAFKGLYLPHAKLIYTYHYPPSISTVLWAPDNVAWSKDGKYIASRGDDNTLVVWQATNGTKLWSINVPSLTGVLDWSPDGTKLAIVNKQLVIQIYDATAHTLRATSSFKGQMIFWSPDSRNLAVTNTNLATSADVALWDGSSISTATPSHTGFNDVTALAWRPDGQYLAAGLSSPNGRMGSAAVWKKGSDLKASQLLEQRGPVSGISWSSASENYIASATSEGVEIWDADMMGQKYQKSYPQFADPIHWSPDGRYVASASSIDFTAQVWNGSTGTLASTCQGHTGRIVSLAWSHDGNYLATVAEDKTARIWHVRS